jgi:hypothetical protein
MARDHEVGTNGYEFYLSRTSTMVAVEMPPLVERLAALITHPDLRREMGAAGRARAREMFDWSVVFRQYQALWAELSALRLGARDEARTGWLAAAPKAAASSLDPFSLFGHYASAWISLATHVTRRPGATVERYQELVAHQLWSHWKSEPPQIAQVLDLLGEGTSVARIAEGAKLSADEAIELVGRLAKMDLVALSNGGAREPQ